MFYCTSFSHVVVLGGVGFTKFSAGDWDLNYTELFRTHSFRNEIRERVVLFSTFVSQINFWFLEDHLFNL